MPWQQLVMALGELPREALEDALLDAGAHAVTLTDAGDAPVLEPAPGTTPLWPETRVTVLLDPAVDAAALLADVCASLAAPVPANYALTTLADRDWEREWLREFRPARFGSRLWVCPHGQPSAEPNAVELFLDPGLAFGTGSHPTTALCLEWLDARPLSGMHVLDYGCGSGILAVAALLLGADAASATDIDPQALEATRRNAEANGVAAALSVCEVGDPALSTEFDLVVANILAGTLIDLADELTRRVRPGGYIALSGILADQADEVAAFYSRAFALDRPCFFDGWAFIAGRRR